jgi:hypothetical protein
LLILSRVFCSQLASADVVNKYVELFALPVANKRLVAELLKSGEAERFSLRGDDLPVYARGTSQRSTDVYAAMTLLERLNSSASREQIDAYAHVFGKGNMEEAKLASKLLIASHDDSVLAKLSEVPATGNRLRLAVDTMIKLHNPNRPEHRQRLLRLALLPAPSGPVVQEIYRSHSLWNGQWETEWQMARAAAAAQKQSGLAQ